MAVLEIFFKIAIFLSNLLTAGVKEYIIGNMIVRSYIHFQEVHYYEQSLQLFGRPVHASVARA